MRRLAALTVAAAVAFGTAGPAAPAAAQSGDPALALAAKTKKKAVRHRARAQPEQQIACTFLGCHPVPAGCHPQIGYDWRGNPTGYDAIACR